MVNLSGEGDSLPDLEDHSANSAAETNQPTPPLPTSQSQTIHEDDLD